MILIIFKKEILEIIRDKRTLVFSLMIPLLLMPIILYMSEKSTNTDTMINDRITIALYNENDEKFINFINEYNINIVKVDNYAIQLMNGNIHSYIYNSEGNIMVYYNSTFTKSQIACSIIMEILNEYNKSLVINNLNNIDVSADILNPLELEYNNINTNKVQSVVLFILPIMLISYCMLGISSTSNDISVGEKARGTIEPLLTTKASRKEILIGKYITIVIMGMLTGLSALIGIILFSIYAGGNIGIKPFNLLLIVLLVLVLSFLFAGITLSIGLYSKTLREASLFTGLITFALLIANYATLNIDFIHTPIAYRFIPVLNVVITSKELVCGILNFKNIFITCLSIMLCSVFSLLIAYKIICNEDMLFRE